MHKGIDLTSDRCYSELEQYVEPLSPINAHLVSGTIGGPLYYLR